MQPLANVDLVLRNPLKKVGLNTHVVEGIDSKDVLALAKASAHSLLKILEPETYFKGRKFSEAAKEAKAAQLKQMRTSIQDGLEQLADPKTLSRAMNVYAGLKPQEEVDAARERLESLKQLNAKIRATAYDFMVDRASGRSISNSANLAPCEIRVIDLVSGLNLGLDLNNPLNQKLLSRTLKVDTKRNLKGGEPMPGVKTDRRKPAATLVIEGRALNASSLSFVLKQLNLTNGGLNNALPNPERTTGMAPYPQFSHFIPERFSSRESGLGRLAYAELSGGIKIHISAKLEPSSKTKQVFMLSQAKTLGNNGVYAIEGLVVGVNPSGKKSK